jgi:hypothetical protein
MTFSLEKFLEEGLPKGGYRPCKFDIQIFDWSLTTNVLSYKLYFET